MFSAIQMFFTGTWPFIAHAGTGMVIMGGLFALAYFSPLLKREFFYAGLAVGLCLFVYGVGVKDEAHRRDARELVLVQTVRDAVRQAVESGEPDPYDRPTN